MGHWLSGIDGGMCWLGRTEIGALLVEVALDH
jgi:hypothetical protein